jgi:D-3-phosphoglycerate dehydrogenase
MKVFFFDPYIDSHDHKSTKLSEPDDLYKMSEILTIHVPLSTTTHSLVGEKEIGMLPRGAFVINTSRGAIIDSMALLDALEKKHLAGAAIDVVSGEPTFNEMDMKLIKYAQTHDNLIITPHIAGATFESVEKTDVYLISKLINWLSENCSVAEKDE